MSMPAMSMRSSKKADDLFITQIAKVNFNSSGALPPASPPRRKSPPTTPPTPPSEGRRRKSLSHTEDDELGQDGNEKSQHTMLLQKAQENLEAQSELQNKRREFHARMQSIKEREKQLNQKRVEFNEQVTKFAKFMNDNEEKRNRAFKKAAEEIKIREGLEIDIKAKITQIEQLKVQKEQSKQALEAIALYQKYLGTVVESSEDFPGVNEILSRHATLADANQQLRQTTEEHSRGIDTLRTELGNLIKEKQNEVLVLNSKMVELKQKLETKRAQVARREQELSLGLNSQQQRSRTMGEIEMAIANLYSRLQLRRPRTDLTAMEQLEVVREIILDTQDIINNCGDPAVVQATKPAKETKLHASGKNTVSFHF